MKFIKRHDIWFLYFLKRDYDEEDQDGQKS